MVSNGLARLSLLVDLLATGQIHPPVAASRTAVLVRDGQVTAEDANAAHNVARDMLRRGLTRSFRSARVAIRIRRRYDVMPLSGCTSPSIAVAFLASDDARYITRQTVIVDGGLLS
jgi:NAD(P)-dependent dehydrogenase (short-subunit alcohol dehydrogenase family)